jgi:hypothetical protein
MTGQGRSESKLTAGRGLVLGSILGVFAVAGPGQAQPAPQGGGSEPAPIVAPEAPPVVVAAPPQEPAPAPEAIVAPAPPLATAPAPEAKKPEVPAAPIAPIKRARYDIAILQALDKVTAETVRFEAAVGKPIRYKSLVFTVKACERSTDDEAIPDAIAYLTIDSQPKAAPGKPTPAPRQAFRGWMYASSPGLHPLEHPVYDAWLITCRAAAPS